MEGKFSSKLWLRTDNSLTVFLFPNILQVRWLLAFYDKQTWFSQSHILLRQSVTLRCCISLAHWYWRSTVLRHYVYRNQVSVREFLINIFNSITFDDVGLNQIWSAKCCYNIVRIIQYSLYFILNWTYLETFGFRNKTFISIVDTCQKIHHVKTREVWIPVSFVVLFKVYSFCFVTKERDCLKVILQQHFLRCHCY